VYTALEVLAVPGAVVTVLIIPGWYAGWLDGLHRARKAKRWSHRRLRKDEQPLKGTHVFFCASVLHTSARCTTNATTQPFR
jgi:hypothetical protein